jgi:outer membrane protein assembly factor BamB
MRSLKFLVARPSLLILLVLTAIALQSEASTRDTYAEPIWTYDSDWNVKHIDTADLNGDNVPDVIAGEYSNDYYGEISSVIAINGLTGAYLWVYTLNDGVRSMAVGDINGDGVADVIAGAAYNGSNTPDGRVHAIDGTDGSQMWTYTVGSTVSSVAIADFNNDTYLDVAAGSFDDYVYAIDGEDGSEIWTHYVGSIFINAVAAGDVNGDGIDDVAFAHEYLAGYDNYLGVLDGTDGDPIWGLTVPYVVLDVILVDIDQDLQLEAIFGGVYNDDHAEIFVRDGLSGSLEWGYNMGAMDHVNGEINLQTMDVDGDSDIDLSVGSAMGPYNLFVFDGTVDTPMWISELLDGFPRSAAVADVTGDEKLNVVVATYDRMQVLDAVDGSKVYYYSVAGTLYDVDVGDFDDDGVCDIAAGGSAEFTGWPPDPGKTVWALRTIESPLLWTYDFGEYGNDLALADLNGDEFTDAVAVCSVDDKAVAISGADGSELWTWVGTENLYAVTTGDFDNNGQVDVAVAGYDETITALDGSDGSILWQYDKPTDQIYRKCLVACDLNGDGGVDVIAGAEDNYIHVVNGITGTELWSCNVGGEVTDLELADMDLVPPLDVVAGVGNGGNKVTIVDGSDGSIMWEFPAPEAVEHIAVGDVTDDGLPDIAAAITPYNPKQVIMIDGASHTQIWTSPVASASNTQSIDAGDINGDKIPDVIVPGNSTDKKVFALDGIDGSELWSYTTGGEVNCVMVYDVDGDEMNEVVAGSDDQIVYVLSGDAGAVEWSYSGADDIMQIRVGDIGGDGRPCLAAVTFGSDGHVYAFESLAPEITFVCGDVNGDEDVNILDIVFLINYKYKEGPAPEIFDSGDVNSDGEINILDIVYLINYKYKEGPEPNCP